MLRSPVKLLPQDVRIQLPSFVLTRTFRPGGFALPAHAHEHTNIALCLSGSYQESLGSKWQRVTSASLMARPVGVPHANNYAFGPSRAVIFEVPIETLDSVSAFSRVLERPLYFESSVVAALASRVGAQLRFSDSVSPLALEALAFELIAYAARESATERGRAPAFLHRAKDFIHAHFRRSLTVTEIAHVAGVHPSHLGRSFRLHIGTTIGEYVRELRVTYAANRLRDVRVSVAEIGAECGFYDQSHFTRAFTRQMQVSPARYRRLICSP